MHITQVAAAVAPTGVSGAVGAQGSRPGRGDFAQAMKVARSDSAGVQEAPASLRVEEPLRQDVAHRTRFSEKVGTAMQSVAEAQARLDAVLRSAQSGRGLSPAALLGLQADVYRSSQLLELAGKVVERGSAGVRQVLTTQL